jgi:hypothetical protein
MPLTVQPVVGGSTGTGGGAELHRANVTGGDGIAVAIDMHAIIQALTHVPILHNLAG